MTERDDRELERLMKEGLEHRAGGVDVDVPVASRARQAASSARWRAPVAAGLVAACVAGVAGGVVLLRDDSGKDGRSGPGVTDSTPAAPGDWRTEYWHDIQVDVPADWGWGGAPMTDTAGDRGTASLIGCGVGAADEGAAYVGRPVYLTDVCQVYDEEHWPEPTAPYVWLGTPIPTGTKEFDNGYVQETVDVAGEAVTVATDDPALRRQILATARESELCLADYDDAATALAFPLVDESGPVGMTVCAYRLDPGGRLRLVYGTTVDLAAAGRFQQAFQDAAWTGRRSDCARPGADVFEVVLLTVHRDTSGDASSTTRYAVDTSLCPGISQEGGADRKALTEADVSPWATDGIPFVVAGPMMTEPWMSRYFIGPRG